MKSWRGPRLLRGRPCYSTNMKMTVKEFKEFVASIPTELDGKEISYVDFSWAEKKDMRYFLDDQIDCVNISE